MANESETKQPNLFVRLKIFLHEVRAEVQKVSFPDRKTVIGSTGVVVVTVFITLVYLYLLDIIFSSVLTYLFR